MVIFLFLKKHWCLWKVDFEAVVSPGEIKTKSKQSCLRLGTHRLVALYCTHGPVRPEMNIFH